MRASALNGLSDLQGKTIGANQGCPFSPTLFSLYIDELDEMVAKFVKEENMDEVVIGKVVIMLCCIQMIWYFLQMLYVLHLLYLDIRCG